MKLSRREFLKWLGIGAAGAVLARVARAVTEDVPRQESSSDEACDLDEEWMTEHGWTLMSDVHPDVDEFPWFIGDSIASQDCLSSLRRSVGLAMHREFEESISCLIA